jgi:hypothetical protein
MLHDIVATLTPFLNGEILDVDVASAFSSRVGGIDATLTPFLNGEMLDVDVASAFSRVGGIDNVDGGLVVFIGLLLRPYPATARNDVSSTSSSSLVPPVSYSSKDSIFKAAWVHSLDVAYAQALYSIYLVCLHFS